MINFIRHDINASSDPKLVKVRMKLGYEGQGLYWSIIEMMAQNKGQLDADYNMLGYLLRSSAETVKKVICDYGLFTFTEDNRSFFSNRLNNELEDIDAKSQKAREKIAKRWSRAKNDTVELQEKYQSNTTVLPQYNCSSSMELPQNYHSNTDKIRQEEIRQEEIRQDNNIIPPKSPQGETADKKSLVPVPVIVPENLSLLAIKPPKELDTPEFCQAWKEWEKYRKEKRQALKPSTIKKQYEELARMGVEKAIESINQSIMQGWTGLFEPKRKSGKTSNAIEEADLSRNPFEDIMRGGSDGKA